MVSTLLQGVASEGRSNGQSGSNSGSFEHYKLFEKLGSAGKKDVSGDIDLSYDVKNIFPDGKPDFKGWGVYENKYNELLAQFTKKARTASPEKLQLRSMIVLIGDKINDALPDVEVDLKASGNGSIFCAIPQYGPNGEKIVWNCIETTHIGCEDRPNPSQIRSEVWMSLIHGSMGIIYFVHEWHPKFTEPGILLYDDAVEAVTNINATGSFAVTVHNNGSGPLSESLVMNFAVIKVS